MFKEQNQIIIYSALTLNINLIIINTCSDIIMKAIIKNEAKFDFSNGES